MIMTALRMGWLHYYLIHESVFEQGPYGFKGVMQFDLFALRVVTRIESDRHLKNAIIALEDLGGELRLKVKAIGANDHTFDDFAAENLVACFHICKDCIVKDIGHEGEHSVCHHMPEHGDAMSAAQKARAIDYVGYAFLDGFEQFRVIAR